MHIHLDADVVKYRAGFAAEAMWYYTVVPNVGHRGSTEPADEPPEVYGGEAHRFRYKKELVAFLKANNLPEDHPFEQQREAEPVANALHNARSIINNVLEELQSTPEDMTVHISGPTNFRTGIATIKKYKGNRDKVAKPVHGDAINEFFKKNYTCRVSEGEEADDTMGIDHYALWLRDPYSSVICSTDKDMKMIPGFHYDFVKDKRAYIDEDAGMRYFYMQLLTGDSTDNIPGCAGVGPAKAARAYENATTEQSMYKIANALYVQSYGADKADEALLENARLLWIRREHNEFWNPPHLSD